MSTGSFEDWQGTMTDIGPLYPFVGSEVLWFLICLVLWIVWHVVQTRIENRTYDDEVQRYGSADRLERLIRREDPENP